MEVVPGLMLVHGNRAERLRDVLVAWLRSCPLGPLENECLLVQSNGIAQWLRLALAEEATGYGVAAALDFLLPGRFLWQAYRAVLGPQAVPEGSPLDKEALTWRLMRLLPQHAGTPGFAPLAHFLAGDEDVRRRYQLARRLADLYDQYQVYRADWLQAWAQGEAILPDAAGGAVPLPEDQVWQALLWRVLLDDVGGSAAPAGRAAIHEAFMARVRAGGLRQRPAQLPRRVVVFGISSLPRQAFEALAALAQQVQVLVCVNNPCQHYWADILGEREQLKARFRRQRHRPGASEPAAADLHRQAQPLLASWGRQGRDFITLLDDFDDPAFRARSGQALAAVGQRVDSFVTLPGTLLLEQLQDDIRDLRPLEETRTTWPPVDPAHDRSIRFQVAHSAQREVEILHDQLLAAFAADPTLQPRDVIVMVPDIEAYAPHIQAVFGLYGTDDARHIPFALADRGQRHADPLVIVLEQLLSLPRLRLGLAEVLGWLDVPALRARFGLDEADLPLLHKWALEANIRWGLDAAQKRAFGLGQPPAEAWRNTWSFGLERMLLGYAGGTDSGAWAGVAPYAGPGGLQAGALGALARLLERIGHHVQALSGPATPDEWVGRCHALLEDFFEPVGATDEHTLLRFRECLQDWWQVCADAGMVGQLPVGIVAEQLLAQLDRAGLAQRFFAGAVTFATLMPMRAIPFRQVCLLGMQDGAFPRARVPADFDLMAARPRPGDRSRREDDRYLFLEALLSARDCLSVSWVGRDIHDNTAQPPSVLVAQLREHLDRGWRCLDGMTPVSQALTCVHPLQPFSRRYFESASEGGDGMLFTYAAEWRAAPAPAPARAATGRLAPRVREQAADLRLLARFLRHPAQAFFRERLRVRFEPNQPETSDLEPYALDRLQEWQVRQALLDAVSARVACGELPLPATALDEALVDLQRGGSLPDGVLGDQMAARLHDALDAPLEDYLQACGIWSRADAQALRVESRLDLPQAPPGGMLFADTLPGVRRNAAGDGCRIHLLASNLVDQRNHYRLAPMVSAWVAHICAQAHGEPLTTLLISPKGKVQFAPRQLATGPQGERWQSVWADLWQAWSRGMCVPLPVEAHTAALWLRSGRPRSAADEHWDEVQQCYEERLAQDLTLRRCWPDFESLVADGEFFRVAEELYGALSDAVGATSTARSAAATGGVGAPAAGSPPGEGR